MLSILRENMLEPLSIFEQKTLRGVLRLSKTAPNCALYFLCGELPIEGKVHRDIFSLFYSVWANPDTKIYQIVNYLSKNSCENSRTWSEFIKQLSEKYSLDEPSKCLMIDPPQKSHYKEAILTKVTAFYEAELRSEAAQNSCMDYLNVSVTGLRGRHHPALSCLFTTEQVKVSRSHLKMLCGDYLTYDKKASQSGGSPHCRACGDVNTKETVSHILTSCCAYNEIRKIKLEEIEDVCKTLKTRIEFEKVSDDKNQLCQFLLDPTSLNLKNRVNNCDPNLNNLFKISRSLCHSINTARLKILKSLSAKTQK